MARDWKPIALAAGLLFLFGGMLMLGVILIVGVIMALVGLIIGFSAAVAFRFERDYGTDVDDEEDNRRSPAKQGTASESFGRPSKEFCSGLQA